MKKVEIACCNIESVIHANRAGADRIELFENLTDGGCTPSYGMIQKSKEISYIPIYVMIRPRGGHFVYSDEEIDIMKSDIDSCHRLEVDGIVFGILNKNNTINISQCKELLEVWNHKPATFHRAFDSIEDKNTATEQLIDLKFERILTSGGMSTAVEGRETILHLHRLYGCSIHIMAGSGIHSENVALFSNLNEIHATCKELVYTDTIGGNYTRSSLSEIEKLVRKFKQS